jgi:glycosyltransferase involved in cell wall biosynthesis
MPSSLNSNSSFYELQHKNGFQLFWNPFFFAIFAVYKAKKFPMVPVVSVIVPNYNHAPYLQKRIDSILEQTYGDYELILLDDCSTDRSASILETYRNHPKVTGIFYNERNSGTTFAQWKKGIGLAKGKYIWLAESDDFADKEFLSTLVAQLEQHPDAVMAFSASNIIDSLDAVIPGVDWDKLKGESGTKFFTSQQLILHKLLRNNMIYNASMVIFRKDAAPEISERYLKMKFCGDWLFWVELAKRGGAIQVCSKLNNFRQHTCKVSTSASKQGLTYTEGLPIVIDMANYLNISLLRRKILAGRICKRLRQFPNLLDSTPALRQNIEQLIQGRALYPTLFIALYEADKILHFCGDPHL